MSVRQESKYKTFLYASKGKANGKTNKKLEAALSQHFLHCVEQFFINTFRLFATLGIFRYQTLGRAKICSAH